MSPRGRLLLALLVVLAAWGHAGALVVRAAFEEHGGAAVPAAVVLASAAVVAVWPLTAGGGAPWQLAVVALLGGAFAAGGVLAIAEALEAWSTRRAFATPGATVSRLLAVALAEAALVAVVARLVGVRRTGWGLAAVALVLVAGAVAAPAAGDPCEDFRFDPARWGAGVPAVEGDAWELTDAERIADALERCATLDGRPRAQAELLLGPAEPAGDPRRSRWLFGWEGSIFLPSPRYLELRYGSDGRVAATRLVVVRS